MTKFIPYFSKMLDIYSRYPLKDLVIPSRNISCTCKMNYFKTQDKLHMYRHCCIYKISENVYPRPLQTIVKILQLVRTNLYVLKHTHHQIYQSLNEI